MTPANSDTELEIARALARARLFPETDAATAPRYRLLETVGRGAMGVVYAAWDAQLERRVALKLVSLERDMADESAQVRLVREAKALARLSHPNAVVVHDAGPISALGVAGTTVAESSNGAFLAMEFVGGTSLRGWSTQAARSGRARLRDVLDVLVQAGHGLAAVHRAGLVHRDVKPDNLMIDPDGRVRLMDFGLARVEASTLVPERPPTPTTTVASGASLTLGGTLGYMAPELLEGRSTAPTHPRVAEILLVTAELASAAGDRTMAHDRASSAMQIRRDAGQTGIWIAEAERILAAIDAAR